jgi:glutamate--cysteine ligase
MSAIIDRLDAIMEKRHADIEDWLHAQRNVKPPFFYTSVDLRHSGAKLSPVDTNLFPAGFNNISPAARGRAIRLIRGRLGEISPKPTRVLIVPENHTRNLFYLENLAVLAELVRAAGAEVRIGSLTATEPLALTSQSGRPVAESVLLRQGDVLATADGFTPDFVLLNNDCTAGPPALLEGIRQPVEPPFKLGWYNRRKTEHFRAYDEIAQEFAVAFGFDPWLISAAFHRCGVVNFEERTGIECVALGVEKVLHTIRRKYEEHGIRETPYVYIKADSGTYGMGIMTVTSGDELLEINKKTRNKMGTIKEGTANTEVIIQEGIPTIERAQGAIAEPMIYLIDGVPVGGAYRVNEQRDVFANLNAPGMRFVGMCDEGECGDEVKNSIETPKCNFGVFGLIAALAALAAGREVYGGLDIGFSI